MENIKTQKNLLVFILVIILIAPLFLLMLVQMDIIIGTKFVRNTPFVPLLLFPIIFTVLNYISYLIVKKLGKHKLAQFLGVVLLIEVVLYLMVFSSIKLG